jgi:predicted O-methyltransferase YrrM
MSIEEMLAWTAANAEGKDPDSGVITYYPDEQAALVKACMQVVPEHGKIIEVGVYCGLSASLLLQVAREKKAAVLLIDNFTTNGEYALAALGALLGHFRDVSVLVFLPELAATHVNGFGAIHFLHIDGDHTYPGVKHDCETWLPHLVMGGLVAFHDYNFGQVDGVMKAADEFTKDWPTIAHVGINGCLIRQKPA